MKLTTQRPNILYRNIGRIILGAFILGAGIAHLTFARKEFQAQVPPWLPLDADIVVIGSGMVEILLGTSLIVLPRHRITIGWITAAFFIAVFPGNIAQWANHRDGFGLDTDTARTVRLFFQPVLILIALWSCGILKNSPINPGKKQII